MNIKADNLPNNLNEVKSLCVELIKENQRLEQTLRLMGRRSSGAKSESWLHPDMKPLFPDQPQAKENPNPQKAKPKLSEGKKERKPYPEELERIDVKLDVPESELVCDKCENEIRLKKVGETVTEKLHLIPAKVTVKRYIKCSYSCPKCERMIAPKSEAHPLPNSGVTIESLAHIATSKYCDSLPLYRQQQIYSRSGVDVSRDNMARWMIQVSDQLKPIYDRLHDLQIKNTTMHIDETSLQVLKESGRKASAKSFLIEKIKEGPPGQSIVLFHYSSSRSMEVIDKLTAGFKGILLSDGLLVYSTLASKRQGLIHCGCWSHARRKFIDAQKSLKHPNREGSLAIEAIKDIDLLFDIERDIKTHTITEKEKQRHQRSKPILERLEKWIGENLNAVPKKSQTGRALHYLNEQWPKLVRFVNHPEIPIHNNTAEREIRQIAIGRKNFLFCQSTKGAHATAVLYSLLSTAKMNKLNPYEYMVQALTGIAHKADIETLLPFNPTI